MSQVLKISHGAVRHGYAATAMRKHPRLAFTVLALAALLLVGRCLYVRHRDHDGDLGPGRDWSAGMTTPALTPAELEPLLAVPDRLGEKLRQARLELAKIDLAMRLLDQALAPDAAPP